MAQKLLSPSGVGSAVARGSTYTADSNGLITVTDPGDIPSLLAGGWTYPPGLTWPPSITLPRVKAINGVTNTSIVSGFVDLYTVPASRRAIMGKILIFNNGSQLATIGSYIKVAGTYYQIGSNSGINANQAVSLALPMLYIAEAGESVSVNIATGSATINIWVFLLEMDATISMFCPKLLSLNAGDNTIYKVPAGRNAVLLGSSSGTFRPLSPNEGGATFYSNQSGGARTISFNVVPAGSTPSALNQIAPATASGGGNIGIISPAVPGALALGPGDFLSMNVDANTPTQWVYTLVSEWYAP